MANTLPAPTEGSVYTNPTTGKRMKFSDGCWKPIDYLPLDGSDSMQGTLWTPDQLINGNTLTADGDENIEIDFDNSIGIPANGAQWAHVIYSEEHDLFVAVSSNPAKSGDMYGISVMYSDDGYFWDNVRVSRTPESYMSVGYGDGVWVVTGREGSTAVSTQTPPRDWSRRDGLPSGGSWSSVVYGVGSDGVGRFVTVASNLTQGKDVCYSTNGTNWTFTGGVNSNTWSSVTYGDGKFVAVSGVGGGTNKVMYSTDGINWTATSSSNDVNKWESVTYSEEKGLFVAVASSGTNRVMYSTDAINWTGVPAANESLYWMGVTYGDGVFLAVSSGIGNRIMYSTDAINWNEAMPYDDRSNWQSVAYGNGKFVAVSSSASSGSSIMVIETSLESQSFGIEGSNDQKIYFNGDPVMIDDGTTRAFARVISQQSTRLGRTKYYQDSALPTGDSYNYPEGSLWYQPTSNNLHFYNDSDQTWVQL